MIARKNCPLNFHQRIDRLGVINVNRTRADNFSQGHAMTSRKQPILMCVQTALAVALMISWFGGTATVSAQPAFQLSETEVRLMKALNSELKVDFKGTPMKEVLDYLEDKTKRDLVFILDEAGIKEAGIQEPGPLFYNDPVTKRYKTMKVRTLLKALLNERGLDYYIEDAQLILTKDVKAAKMIVVKVHDLGDLLDSKNIDGSKKELQNAVKLLDPKIVLPTDPVPAPLPAPAKEQKKKGLLSDAEPAPAAVPEPPGAQIITHKRLLVVRHAFEMQIEVERLLAELRGIPASDLSGIDLDSRR